MNNPQRENGSVGMGASPGLHPILCLAKGAGKPLMFEFNKTAQAFQTLRALAEALGAATGPDSTFSWIKQREQQLEPSQDAVRREIQFPFHFYKFVPRLFY